MGQQHRLFVAIHQTVKVHIGMRSLFMVEPDRWTCDDDAVSNHGAARGPFRNEVAVANLVNNSSTVACMSLPVY